MSLETNKLIDSEWKEMSIVSNDGRSGAVWDVRDLWKATEGLEVILIPISDFIPILRTVEDDFNQSDYERVKEADLSYPIIVSRVPNSDVPLIIDGYHRLVKAYKKPNTFFIRAVYLDVLPLPTKLIGKKFSVEWTKFEWKTKD